MNTESKLAKAADILYIPRAYLTSSLRRKVETHIRSQRDVMDIDLESLALSEVTQALKTVFQP